MIWCYLFTSLVFLCSASVLGIYASREGGDEAVYIWVGTGFLGVIGVVIGLGTFGLVYRPDDVTVVPVPTSTQTVTVVVVSPHDVMPVSTSTSTQ
jgi:hypothetical protein